MSSELRLLVAGFGNVGRAFVRRLLERRMRLGGRKVVVVGIVDSKGALTSPSGLPEQLLRKALEAPRGGVSSLPGGSPGVGVLEVLEESAPHVLVEVTPSTYWGECPAVRHVVEALRRGVHVVTANKAPMALACRDVMRACRASGAQIRFRAAVVAGTPLADVIQVLAEEVEEVLGVLNGTTNYVLNLVHDGCSFEEALRRAIEEGYAEPDPSLDIDGWDPAAKISVISCALGKHIPVHEVVRRGLREALNEALNEAKKVGGRVRYLARLDVRSGRASVEPSVVKPDSPFYELPGTTNAALLRLRSSEVIIRGPGAGPDVTADALLRDLERLASVS